MTAAAAVALWHRAHLYKAIACVVLALIAIQYLLSGVIDRRSIETIFTINATRYVQLPPARALATSFQPATLFYTPLNATRPYYSFRRPDNTRRILYANFVEGSSHFVTT